MASVESGEGAGKRNFWKVYEIERKDVGGAYNYNLVLSPVCNAYGTVNMDASRRVVFRFRLNTDV